MLASNSQTTSKEHVSRIGFGAMGLSYHFFGGVKQSDEERLEVSREFLYDSQTNY